jgi:hypothetical protein
LRERLSGAPPQIGDSKPAQRKRALTLPGSISREPADAPEGPIGAGRAGENEMGTVVKFPGVWRVARSGKSIGKKRDSAIVIILPVIRIERFSDQPAEIEPIRAQRRSRRPRASHK